MAGKGGPQKPDFKNRPPSATGGARSDMAGNQPVRVPTGLPYGDRAKLEGMQQAVPAPDNRPSMGTGPAAGAGAVDLRKLLTSAPTMRPNESPAAPMGEAAAPQAAPRNPDDDEWVAALMELANDPRSSDEIKMLALAATHAWMNGGNEFFPSFGEGGEPF